MNTARHTAPLRHVVVLGHPATHSFNRAIAERYCEVVRDCGQEVVLRDLYALDFDPRLHADRLPGLPTDHLSGDVSRELGLLHGADVIVFIYPLWFGMPPAIIKGYVDRVLGEALTPRDIKNHIPDAILNRKRFATFSTSATTRAWLEEQGQWQSLHQAFDAYLLSIFGMRDGGHTHFDAIVDPLDPLYAAETLFAVGEKARVLCSTALAERHATAVESLLIDRG
ncbi:NAD(P)H-dependent oxidoreductase [Sphingomonas faeni]|uniref:NAD(P)H-dependent oxidoreductase n=1 Tax=Sphingomonas faeni TaxID=185950 RepID=UPI0020C7A40A|nr:NAD(P)H-dependent oxidoreductase [Sphingomonas faeni]MCP8891623.1 NAD(P)H-dependent oxidoreductase [Sphingomonas faeni]